MEVIEYLNKQGSPASAIEFINSEYGIKVREYWDEMLFVFNYDQINSPKTHPITKECRGLILTWTCDNGWSVVSRSFDRFFNLGEAPDEYPHFDITEAVVYEKVDGSLIKIYNYKGYWYCCTRGTAFAETATPMGVVFKDLIYKAIGVEDDEGFQYWCEKVAALNPEWTVIFELTCRENRVVKHYDGYSLWYLCSRQNFDGKYEHCTNWPEGVHIPKEYRFDTLHAIEESAKLLNDLDEGYVCYQDGIPTVKVKSPVYVAVHHIRSQGPVSPKTTARLVITGEAEEYLTYYPEEREFIQPYIDGWEDLFESCRNAYETYKDIECQKQFAITIKHLPYSNVLFKARSSKDGVKDVLQSLSINFKIKLLLTGLDIKDERESIPVLPVSHL